MHLRVETDNLFHHETFWLEQGDMLGNQLQSDVGVWVRCSRSFLARGLPLCAETGEGLTRWPHHQEVELAILGRNGTRDSVTPALSKLVQHIVDLFVGVEGLALVVLGGEIEAALLLVGRGVAHVINLQRLTEGTSRRLVRFNIKTTPLRTSTHCPAKVQNRGYRNDPDQDRNGTSSKSLSQTGHRLARSTETIGETYETDADTQTTNPKPKWCRNSTSTLTCMRRRSLARNVCTHKFTKIVICVSVGPRAISKRLRQP
jgi:hypothetical protein